MKCWKCGKEKSVWELNKVNVDMKGFLGLTYTVQREICSECLGWDRTEHREIPQEGRLIKITWLPSCINVPKGTPNPYIGMEGEVIDLRENGDFTLKTETSYLVVTRKFGYRYVYL